MTAVDRDVPECQPNDPVVRLQGDQFELLEDAQLDPLVTALADGRGRASPVGGLAVTTPEDEYLNKLV